ncbi:ATP-grasp domain-containing protein [Streptomyces sp. NPDC058953]|uniref:ATP-grasp domain-containing protein n=1 Tax=unclassified Streptomyces TaxID=2593676 RepID=UPI0036899FD7
MTVAALESLPFGLERLALAAAVAGHRLALLTSDRTVYRHELAAMPEEILDIVDVDTTDPGAVRRALAGLPDLVGLVNTTDTWSVPAADLAAELGLPGPDPADVRVLRDKALVRQRLHAAGLSRIVASTHPAAVELPAVLKDSAGTSSRGVWIVHDEAELRAALTEAAACGGELKGRLFAEPFLPGPLYSAETLSWKGETRLLGVSSRQMSRTSAVREEGAAFPVGLPPGGHETLARWAADVLATAGHDQGFAHVEFVETSHGPELVEINRRIGGGLVGEALCRALGTDVYDAVIEVAIGLRPTLMDGPLVAPFTGPAVAFVLVYPDRPGTLTGWRGLDGLGAFPGNVEWFPVRAPGDVVHAVGDQRACTGLVLAEAETAELAQHRAWSAAASVRPLMGPLPTGVC